MNHLSDGQMDHIHCFLATAASSGLAAGMSPIGDILKTICVSVISGLITFTISQTLAHLIMKGKK